MKVIEKTLREDSKIDKKLNVVLLDIFDWASQEEETESDQAALIASTIRKSITYCLKNSEIFEDDMYFSDDYKDRFKKEKFQ